MKLNILLFIIVVSFNYFIFSVTAKVSDYAEPTEYAEPSEYVEPSDYAEPSEYVYNIDSNIDDNSSKSVKISGEKLTQEKVDELSELVDLNELSFNQTEINGLDFKNFINLKNLTTLKINFKNDDYDSYNYNYVSLDILKYCMNLKTLSINGVYLDRNSLDAIGYATNLEELALYNVSFEDGADFSSIENLKNLTYLNLDCSGDINSLSSNLFHLTKLQSLTISYCKTMTISTSTDKSLTWANLKNLEYLNLRSCSSDIMDLKYLGDIPSLKEVYLIGNGYSSIPENIENLKNLEVLEMQLNYFD